MPGLAHDTPGVAVSALEIMARPAFVVLSALAAAIAASALVGKGTGKIKGSGSMKVERPLPARRWGQARAFRSAVLQEFPYAVELLALCCLSGMNLSQAVDSVGRLGSGPVQRAFVMTSQDLSAGFTRRQALSRLAARLGTSSALSLVSAVKQSEASGTPVVDILRTHAEVARREQYAERLRQAELMPLKLAVCTVMFLLPALVIVSVVPHVLAFVKSGW